jgi:hypothetical protein
MVSSFSFLCFLVLSYQMSPCIGGRRRQNAYNLHSVEGNRSNNNYTRAFNKKNDSFPNPEKDILFFFLTYRIRTLYDRGTHGLAVFWMHLSLHCVFSPCKINYTLHTLCIYLVCSTIYLKVPLIHWVAWYLGSISWQLIRAFVVQGFAIL